MPVVTPALAAIIFTAGVVSGTLGALLGLGGGVFLVPFLNLVLGFPFSAAAAISLTTVIATSSTVSAGRAGKELSDLRLRMLVEVAAAGGSGRGQIEPVLAAAAVLGVQLGSWGGMRFGAAASAKWLKVLMSAVLFIVAAMMFARGGR